MRFLSWLRGEHDIEDAIRSAHRECGVPDNGLSEVELQQARILDGMTQYDAEHVVRWTGSDGCTPVIDYEDLSDRWIRERHEKEDNEKQSRR